VETEISTSQKQKQKVQSVPGADAAENDEQNQETQRACEEIEHANTQDLVARGAYRKELGQTLENQRRSWAPRCCPVSAGNVEARRGARHPNHRPT